MSQFTVDNYGHILIFFTIGLCPCDTTFKTSSANGGTKRKYMSPWYGLLEIVRPETQLMVDYPTQIMSYVMKDLKDFLLSDVLNEPMSLI